MEKDDEVEGQGNSYTATFWQYNDRLGRRWNIDPVKKEHLSSYATFSNNPIIYIDPEGNTDFFFNGKWIGTDGKENNLIAIVKDKETKNLIWRDYTKKGKFYKKINDELSNGYSNDNVFVVDKDVLNESKKILNKAINEEGIIEYNAVLDKKDDGVGYNVTSENKGGELVVEEGQTFVKGAEFLTEGEVSIHSHPIKSEFLIEKQPNGKYKFTPIHYDALVPTPYLNEKMQGDIPAFKKYKMNIIVGKNGDDFSALLDKDDDTKFQSKSDNRGLYINFFDLSASLIYTLSQDDANKIGNNQTIRRKNKFKRWQEKAQKKKAQQQN